MIFSTRRPATFGAVLGVSLGVLALAGCAKNKGELVVDDSIGVTALRSPCPVVAIPEMTGDITLFNAPGRTDSGAIDVVASITNLRSTCDDATNGAKLTSNATFDVVARRTDTRGARHVDIPYFSVVMRGGTQVLAKRVGTIGIDFADGQERASARGSASSSVDRAEATLPREVRDRLNKKRKPGDADAATDPLAQPDVKAALAKASFELLVGFQLTNDQLAYNATR
ncbi:hypothetical protein [Novosphingobium olei]|uniref:Uncharacterized protein n=1 Tax=Novosphingobium olei TaxID=2728851 RepID=A0A7Y0BL32_9SPHN|nr:hypothetical protein [Novosphingobium olei]NML92457.1 hypothetical protein [Novosphingobium olei]